MMNPHEIVATASLVLSVFILLATWQFVLLPTAADGLRQDLFRARRRLFMLVAQKKVDPAAPGYAYIRDGINWMLRNSEQITLSRIIVCTATATKLNAELTREELRRAIDSVPDAASELRSVREDVTVALVHHFMRTSPPMWFLTIVVGAVVLLAHGVSGCRSMLIRIGDRIQIERTASLC